MEMQQGYTHRRFNISSLLQRGKGSLHCFKMQQKVLFSCWGWGYTPDRRPSNQKPVVYNFLWLSVHTVDVHCVNIPSQIYLSLLRYFQFAYLGSLSLFLISSLKKKWVEENKLGEETAKGEVKKGWWQRRGEEAGLQESRGEFSGGVE